MHSTGRYLLRNRSYNYHELITTQGFCHIAQEIFQYLDDSSLAKCRQVCKNWQQFIDNSFDYFFYTRFLTKYKTEENALFESADEGFWPVFRCIFEQAKVKNPADEKGYTPLHFAAWEGHLQIVQLILQNTKRIHPKTDYHGFTPLHYATLSGHLPVIKCLLKRKTQKLPKDEDGKTPLHLAAENGHFEICKLILDNVSDKHPLDRMEEAPLHRAWENGRLSVCKLFE